MDEHIGKPEQAFGATEPLGIEPLPDDDSFAPEASSPADAQVLRDLEVQNARLQVTRATEKAAAERRMNPSAPIEGDTFDSQMRTEERYTAEHNGLTYGVFRLNRQEYGGEAGPNRPVVLLLGLLGRADKGEKRDFVHEVALHNPDREIIVIQREGIGSSTIPDKDWVKNVDVGELGKGRLDVLDQMGVDDFDVVGYSFGAVAAVGLAAEAGDRAHTLVTLGLPGFEGMTRKDKRRLIMSKAKEFRNPGRVVREVMSRLGSRGGDEAENSAGNQKRTWTERKAHARTSAGLGRMISSTGQVREALAQLAPSTHWTDVVGNADVSTKWPSHLSAARSRTEPERPHNSDVMLLTDRGDTHLGLSTAHAMMAEIAARALDRQDKREA